MVKVRIVRMAMHQPNVPVGVGVRFTRHHVGAMGLPMVLVVHVPVLVLHVLVCMLVLVTLRQMQPQPDRHQAARNEQGRGDRFPQHRNRQRRTHERREREVGAGPSRAEMAEPQHEQRQAHAVA